MYYWVHYPDISTSVQKEVWSSENLFWPGAFFVWPGGVPAGRFLSRRSSGSIRPFRVGSVTIAQNGTPEGPGIWVELRKIPAGSSKPESVMSAASDGFGDYGFEGVKAHSGDIFFVTFLAVQ